MELLGEPLVAVCIWAVAYGKEQGEDRIYAVSSGEPCVLYVIDPHSNRCLNRILMDGAKHCWGVVAVESGVYAAGDGKLYRYLPEKPWLGVQNLGFAIEGEHYSWRLTADDDGAVYGGVYPGGKAFRYDPAAEKFRDYGQIVSNEQYVRCMKALDGKLYIGIGTGQPHLIVMDTVSGAKDEISLPLHVSDDQMVYDLDIAGDYFFIRLTPSNRMLVYSRSRQLWVDELEDVLGLAVSPPDNEGNMYFIKDDWLHSYHPDTKELARKTVHQQEHATDYTWVEWEGASFPGKSLLSIRRDGSYWVYNPVSDALEERNPNLEGRPIAIQSLACGPDGRIYAGGYFAGGLASLDCNSSQFISYKGIGQIEGMTSYGNMLYMGVYPKAKIYRYDPSAPWDKGSNPQLVVSLNPQGQDRPFAFCAAGEELAIGTVPDYGKRGGALTMLRPSDNRVEVYRNVIEEQSIVSLAYRGGTLYAGSSVWGGLGAPPSEKEAVLMAWDTLTREKNWKMVPIAGERAISALVFDSFGSLWGLTAGILFEIHPESCKVLRKVQLFPFDWSSRGHYWRGGFLRLQADGTLIGTTLGRLFRYKPIADHLEVMDEDAYLLEQDHNGAIYTARGTQLCRFRFES